jgi:arylsulfatase A-like enzyme
VKLTDFSRKPNVVIIITDQEREVMHWPDGWAEANLPARSRLLRHGLRFTRAQCNTAACSPSRATFLTGLYPAQHGVRNLIRCDKPNDLVQNRLPVLPSRLPNLATVMRAAGYHVVLKGKFHLSRPVAYNRAMKRHYWSDADVAHLGERYGGGRDASVRRALSRERGALSQHLRRGQAVLPDRGAREPARRPGVSGSRRARPVVRPDVRERGLQAGRLLQPADRSAAERGR